MQVHGIEIYRSSGAPADRPWVIDGHREQSFSSQEDAEAALRVAHRFATLAVESAVARAVELVQTITL